MRDNGEAQVDFVLRRRLEGSVALGVDTSAYTTEDGQLNYTTEDGLANYTPTP